VLLEFKYCLVEDVDSSVQRKTNHQP